MHFPPPTAFSGEAAEIVAGSYTTIRLDARVIARAGLQYAAASEPGS